MGRKFSLLLVFLSIFATASCGKNKDVKSRVLTGYEYQNPELGQAVTLRPAKEMKPTPQQQFSIQNPNLIYDKDTKNVKLTVDFTLKNKTETIVLRGQLDKENQTAVLSESETGKNRLGATVACVYSSNCSEMYANVYYNLNGNVESQQFVVLREVAKRSKKTLTRAKPAPSPAKKTDAEPSNNEFFLMNDHGDDESETSIEGGFVTAPVSEDFKKRLEVIVTEDQPAIPKSKPEKKPPQTQSPFNLTDGGWAKGRPSGGRIENSVSSLPDQGSGFSRTSSRGYSFGSGLTVDFLKKMSATFAKGQSCGTVLVNQLSKEGGGKIVNNGVVVHKSHQNGQDIDVAYLTFDKFTDVLSAKIDKNFYDCNWKFFELLTAQKFPDHSPVVSKIFVNPKIKKSFCNWARSNDLDKSEVGKQVLRRLYPWEGHTMHFHIRLNCTPLREGCWNDVEIPDATGC